MLTKEKAQMRTTKLIEKSKPKYKQIMQSIKWNIKNAIESKKYCATYLVGDEVDPEEMEKVVDKLSKLGYTVQYPYGTHGWYIKVWWKE